MNKHIVFSIDLNRCINCKTCQMSCNEFYSLVNVHRRNVFTFENGREAQPIHLSISCNHCMNPVCVYICPENNFQKREDGIVVLQATNCRGCRKCVEACPFHAPKWNPLLNRVDKCNFCVERIEQDLRPVCVENCTTSALSYMMVNSDEIESHQLKKEHIPLSGYTKPSIKMTEKNKGFIFLRGE